MDIVQARMINEVLYCERLMYLERVQGEFEHNYFTVDGNAAHQRVDVPGGDLSASAEVVDGRPYDVRSVWLSSDELGISAKIDVVDVDGNTAIPVEYKRGKPPEVPERAYLPERAQVCAQVLLLREKGYRVPEGAIYFAAAKRRVAVAIDDELIETTLRAAERVRELTAMGRLPPPLVDSPKCVGCSLISICLPDEVNALRPLTFEAKKTEPRQLHPARDERLPLHVQEPGARVGLSGDCLTVRVREKVSDVPIAHTSQLCLYGNVQLSTQALRELLYRDIPTSFFTTGGWYCGRVVGVDSKNVELRLGQYRVAIDEVRALQISRGLVAAKIKNGRTLLRRNAEPSARTLDDLEQFADRAGDSEAIATLLGIEGSAARLYFENFSKMLRAPSDFSFEHRNRRPPRDPVNALLSFSYALLVKDFSLALHAVGLDPLVGVYHRPRYGRPSLALDLMEEFRPVIADSVVITAINTGVLGEKDFVRAAGAVALTPAARRDFIQVYERRMAEEVKHPVFGYRVSYRRVIEVQCRLFSRYLLGEIEAYPQFLVR